MRPRYCTADDRDNEHKVIRFFTNWLARTAPQFVWGFKHADKMADFDGEVLRDNRTVAIVEIKNRTGNGERFDTWHIALAKIQSCKEHAASLGVKFILIFNWDGAIYFIDGNQIPMDDVRQGGRTDRNDPYDVEPMIHIPVNLFKKIYK